MNFSFLLRMGLCTTLLVWITLVQGCKDADPIEQDTLIGDLDPLRVFG